MNTRCSFNRRWILGEAQVAIVDNLAVFIAGRRAGTIRQAYDGALSFSYEGSYDAVPLSLSMPKIGRAHV